MAYLSLILPAFHFNSYDLSEIQKEICHQFNITEDKFELLEFKDNTQNKNYGIKLLESSLSLSSIEDLIYLKSCMQSLNEKTLENLQTMTERLKELEHQLKFTNIENENGNNEGFKKELINDNIKLRELLASQIEYSDNFRMNTEITMNKIKDEFKTMVKELELLRKKAEKNKRLTKNSSNFYKNNKNVVENNGNNFGHNNTTTKKRNELNK